MQHPSLLSHKAPWTVVSTSALCMYLFFSQGAFAEYYLPADLVTGGDEAIADLAKLSGSAGQLPGIYEVAIQVNGQYKLTKKVKFIATEETQETSDEVTNGEPTEDSAKELDTSDLKQDKPLHDDSGLTPCLSQKDLQTLGIDLSTVKNADTIDDKTCVSINNIISGAYTLFDFQKMRLEISVPQIAMQRLGRGGTSPALWDEGINAALLNYRFNGSNSSGASGDRQSSYLNLDGGFNLGGWRIRDAWSISRQSNQQNTEQNVQHLKSYVGRTIIPLKSELRIGDSTTSGSIFDSLGLRGVQLWSDDSMSPNSERGFAPIIRGTANSNAKVTIKQNGYIVYETNVSSGEFAIDDLYPMYSSGDLDVEVVESDGSVQTFSVPYSSVPVLIREGRWKYEFAAGQYRSSSDQYDTPTFMQGTLTEGISQNVTLYQGLQLSDKYRAGLLGIGLNMGEWGALSMDMTYADSILPDDRRDKGQSFRFLYGRSFMPTGTTFQLVGYRYSTQGFHTLDETALKETSGWLHDNDLDENNGSDNTPDSSDYYDLSQNKHMRLQANISQKLGDYGSVYLNGVRESYWGVAGISESVQLGYSNSWAGINYNLSYRHERNPNFAGADNTLYMSMSFPLSKWLSSEAPPVYATSSMQQDKNGNMSFNNGISGVLLEQNNLSWQVSEGHSAGSSANVNAGMTYSGGYGQVSAGYSHSAENKQVSYGVSGGLIAHSDGVTFGQSLGETNILVSAPGANDLPLESGHGVSTDWNGYAIKPYASNYRENRVALDVSELNDTTEIENTVQNVIPTRGAIVRADFTTKVGFKAILTLNHQQKRVPFGSSVTSEDGINSGIVGDDGQVYLTGLSKKGLLNVQWGSGRSQRCHAEYEIPEKDDEPVTLVQITAPCV